MNIPPARSRAGLLSPRRPLRPCGVGGGFSLLLLLPFLLGLTWQIETDGKYRVYVGPDRATDWVDVCCHHTLDPFQLTYADYTPIEEITMSRKVKGGIEYRIRKAYSTWVLFIADHDPDFTQMTLRREP